MRCKTCGVILDNGEIHCSNCGQEVQIVPDYNPLDDVLTEQVKGSLRLPAKSKEDLRNRQELKEQRRRQEEKRRADERRRQERVKRERMRKKQKRNLILMAIGAVALLIVVLLLYQSSYNGLVRKGNKQLSQKAYEEADGTFRKAIKKGPKRVEAYTGLSKAYIGTGDLEGAEQAFLDAIDTYSETVELYEGLIQFYLDTEQPQKVTTLLAECEDTKITDALKEYASDEPVFSLDEGTYEEVQEVSLTSDEEEIYYTLDGSSPMDSGNRYTEPIQLDEGVTTITAVAVNEKGIPSPQTKAEYTVEFPVEDAPAVSPSTGQYEQEMSIRITVPDGYTAYYTMDGSVPTPNEGRATKKYTGEIDMPEGNTIFSAILVNSKGKTSDVTKRNYVLSLD